MIHITERGKREGGEGERGRERGRERVLKDSERGYKERIKSKDTHIFTSFIKKTRNFISDTLLEGVSSSLLMNGSCSRDSPTNCII